MQATRPFIDSDWQEISELQRKLTDVFEPQLYTPLDDAYYGRAMTLYGACAKHYDALSQTEQGSRFILNAEEAGQFVSELRRARVD